MYPKENKIKVKKENNDKIPTISSKHLLKTKKHSEYAQIHQYALGLLFTAHSTQNRSFWRCSSQPISWHGTEETKHNTSKGNSMNKNCLS